MRINQDLTKLPVVSEIILSCYPDWQINSIFFLGEGDFFYAYLVNNEWVFRFAKHENARQSLQREYCLLPKIAGEITLEIPVPQIASFKTGYAFSAYHHLPDNSLTKEIYLNFNEAQRNDSAKKIAHFLNQFHSIETKFAQNCGVQFCDYKSQYTSLLAEAKEYLFPIIEKADRFFIEQVIEDFLASDETFHPTLLHGDLSPDHILFDQKTNLVTGIIDFGDMMIGDAFWDLLWIYEDYGLDLLSRLLCDLDESNLEDLPKRLFRFSQLQLIEWTVNCKIKEDEEFKRALLELKKIRKDREKRFDEMISVCKI